MGKPEAMAAFGIASRTPLDSWCRLYREGGADALRPKPKGRPKGSAAQSAPKTREQELEARVRRLEAEKRLLKKVRDPGGGEVSSWEKSQVIEMLSGQGHALSDLLAAAGLPRSTYYRARSHPPRRRGRSYGRRWRRCSPARPTAADTGRIAMALRAEEDVAIADKTALKIMHEMGISCGIRRESDYHRYNSFKGVVGRAFDSPGQGLLSRRTLAEARHGRHRVQGPVGQGLLCPSVRLRQQGDRVLEHIAVCEHGAAKGDAGRPAGEDAGGASPVMHSDMDGSTSTTVIARRSRRRASSRACRERQLHRQRRDRAGLRPYQGRVLPRAELRELRGVQGEARGVHRPLEHEAKAG